MPVVATNKTVQLASRARIRGGLEAPPALRIAAAVIKAEAGLAEAEPPEAEALPEAEQPEEAAVVAEASSAEAGAM